MPIRVPCFDGVIHRHPVSSHRLRQRRDGLERHQDPEHCPYPEPIVPHRHRPQQHREADYIRWHPDVAGHRRRETVHQEGSSRSTVAANTALSSSGLATAPSH